MIEDITEDEQKYILKKRSRSAICLPTISTRRTRAMEENKHRRHVDQLLAFSDTHLEVPEMAQTPRAPTVGLKEEIRSRLHTVRQTISQMSDEEIKHSRQRIIQNRMLFVRFAERTRPKNASLSRRQRQNLLTHANSLINPLKGMENIDILDRILHALGNRPSQVGLPQQVKDRQVLAGKLKKEVKEQITKQQIHPTNRKILPFGRMLSPRAI